MSNISNIWDTASFRTTKRREEFERLTALEYPELSLEKQVVGGASDYLDPRTEKLWTFWLQAFLAGKHEHELL